MLPLVREAMAGDASGHDLAHVLRVRAVALRIAAIEGADGETTELIALLHDVANRSGRRHHGARGADLAAAWLTAEGCPPGTIAPVCEAIATLSWSSGRTPATLEGRVVQDADRLDAIGAIGVARAFAFGGAHGRPPGLPAPGLELDEPGNTVAHFDDKLLRLASTLHTATARRVARGRHAFCEEFLRRVRAEAAGG